MQRLISRFFPRLVCVGLLVGWLGARTDAPAADTLQPGERVVFLGDSITQAGAGPGGYVTRIKEKLGAHKPALNIEIIGAGISGNRVPDLEKRLEKDVLSRKPTRVVIYIGINDVWHSQQGRGTPKDEFEQGLRRIIKAIQDQGAKVSLCTASVIGEKTDGSNKLDGMLDEYCEISRRVAKDTGSQMIDLRKAFLHHLKSHNAANAEKDILTNDGVHLNDAGNQFVAEQMLASLTGASSARLLRHMVLFKFKAEATPAQVQEVVDAFKALPAKINTIHDFEAGTDVGVENLADGFTHGFLVTFRDEKGRADYLPHPEHQKFVELVKPRVEKVLVFDYWTK